MASGSAATAKADTAALLPPCEIQRTWPGDCDLASVFQDKPGLAVPGRYLHPGLQVQMRDSCGMCLVATQAYEAGDLLLVDTAVELASTRPLLKEAICKRLVGDSELLNLLQYFSDVEQFEASQAAKQRDPLENYCVLVEAALRRGCRMPGPEELQPAAGNKHGFWPLAAMLNHRRQPNAVRACFQQTFCLRALQNINAGDEVTDDYLSPLLPRAQRVEILRSTHNIEDEGNADEFDAPAETLEKVANFVDEAEGLLKEDLPSAAFEPLTAATNLCIDSDSKDPAFAQAFAAFARVAGCLRGGGEMQLQGLAKALEFACARQPFSAASCGLVVELFELQMDGSSEHHEARGLKRLLQEHVARVYGPQPSVLEALLSSTCEAPPSTATPVDGRREDRVAPLRGTNSANGEEHETKRLRVSSDDSAGNIK